MKIKKIVLPIILIISLGLTCSAEVIEKIYAVVNGEMITHTDLKNTEIELTNMISRQFTGEELKKNLADMKSNLMDSLIQQKIILSVAREKNYDMENEIEIMIKEIKKQNNMKSDDELKAAIASQGMNFDNWKKQLKEQRIQSRLVYEEIGSQIKIDNAKIMAYYREHMNEYTEPKSFSLNCIYLDKASFATSEAADERKKEVIDELKKSSFEDTAKKYSQLPNPENKHFLGNFKEGDLHKNIESAALKLKEKELSSWVDADTGWYLLQLIKITEPKLVEYKKVSEQIKRVLSEKEQEGKLKELVEKLKKNSYIKIYEKY